MPENSEGRPNIATIKSSDIATIWKSLATPSLHSIPRMSFLEGK